MREITPEVIAAVASKLYNQSPANQAALPGNVPSTRT